MAEKIENLKRLVDRQREVLNSLASSLEDEDRLEELIRRIEKPCEALSSLVAGLGASEGFVLHWPETRKLFLRYVEFKRYNRRNATKLVSYLDRFVQKPIASPFDVMQIFAPLTVGQRHHLNRALRAWLKCLEINNPNKEFEEFLDGLRKAIPKDEIGVDVKVPEEAKITSDLEKMRLIPIKYRVAYNLLLDSGLRLVEVVKILNDSPEMERLEGFYRCPVGLFRGTKQAYYCYMTEYTYELIRQLKEKLSEGMIEKWCERNNLTRPKYLRKFANDTMTSEKLNIPESVSDFIQGRVPKTIGAKHYMQLKRKADQYYPRYAQYLTELRQRAKVFFDTL